MGEGGRRWEAVATIDGFVGKAEPLPPSSGRLRSPMTSEVRFESGQT